MAPYAPAPSPSLTTGRIAFGSFNNVSKISDAVAATWAELLTALPDSRLILKWRTLADPATRQRFLRMFGDRGIAPERLDLRPASPHRDMLAEYGDIDVALDPFPFSGGQTSCEALWMGVPVVTMPGARPVSRQTAGFLRLCGLDDLVAQDIAGYVGVACGLAEDRDRLSQGRLRVAGLRDGSPLTDCGELAADIESAFRGMWRTWCGAAA